MIKKKVILYFVFGLFFNSIVAQESETLASGLWSDASNWDNGIPTSTIDANLGFFDRITVDINAQCKDVFTSVSGFTINSGITLTIFGQCNVATFSNGINNGTLVLKGNLVSNNLGSTLTINGSVTSMGGITLTSGVIE